MIDNVVFRRILRPDAALVARAAACPMSDLYEALPLVYIAAGVLQLLCAFLIEAGPRALLLVLGAVCLTAGLVVWMRRRDYRATQEEYQRPPLD